MRSTELLLCIFALAWGSSNAELTCYECAGKNDDCPHIIDTLNNPLEPVECQGVLSTVCTKFSIEYLSGDFYTYRNCAPSTLEYGEQEIEFCPFISALYKPLIAEGLIKDIDCATCTTYECNT